MFVNEEASCEDAEDNKRDSGIKEGRKDWEEETGDLKTRHDDVNVCQEQRVLSWAYRSRTTDWRAVIRQPFTVLVMKAFQSQP